MAANIDMSNGRANAVYVGEGPWHHLFNKHYPEGTILTPAQFLADSGTDWELKETVLTYMTEHGAGQLENERLLYRGDNGAPIHVCSKSYVKHQHRELYDIQREVVSVAGEYGLDFSSVAGFALSGGRKIVYVLKLNQELKVAGDKFYPYLFSTTSHDESWATTHKFAMFRPDCENMTRAALSGALPGIKLKHTSEQSGRTQQIREQLGLFPKVVATFEDQVERMIAQLLTKDETREVVEQVFEIPADRDSTKTSPSVRRRAEVTSMLENDRRVGFKGTAWGVYQAVNTWEHHVRGDLKKEARAAQNAERFLSDTMTFTNRALEVLTALTPVAVAA